MYEKLMLFITSHPAGPSKAKTGDQVSTENLEFEELPMLYIL